jgi:nitroreductase
MNPLLQFIFARRSVRKYAPQPVAHDLVQDLLEAAMSAPSAVAKDPWEFIVVRTRETLQRLAAHLPNGQMLGQAALGVVVCGDLERAHDRQLSYLLQDCSASIENLLLAAHALGLGACWLGVHPRTDRVEHVRSLLHIPTHVLPVSIISVGWPDESPPPRTRYRVEAVHQESW